MIYMIGGLMPHQSGDEYREFIGSTEHLRRMKHHIDALTKLRIDRIVAGRPFRMVSVGMGSPAETSTIRNARGQAVFVDGPFAETKEVMGGFDLIDFDVRDDALEFARREHAPGFSHTQVVRGIARMWWADSIKSAASASLFLLRLYGEESSWAEDIGALGTSLLRVGAEYWLGRGTIDDNNLSWSVGVLEPRTGVAIKFDGGKEESAQIPRSADGRVQLAFVLASFRSASEAGEWSQKLATRDGDAVEIRSVTRYSWFSQD